MNKYINKCYNYGIAGMSSLKNSYEAVLKNFMAFYGIHISAVIVRSQECTNKCTNYNTQFLKLKHYVSNIIRPFSVSNFQALCINICTKCRL